MNPRPVKGQLKHWDFIVLDLVCLQAAFLLAHTLLLSDGNPYEILWYRYLILMLTIAQVLTIILTDNYSGITRRGYLEEMYSVLRFAANMLILALLLMFGFHTTFIVSRLLTGWTMIAFLLLDYTARTLNKRRIVHNTPDALRHFGRALIVMAPGGQLQEVIGKLTAPGIFRDYFIAGCVTTDGIAADGNFDFAVEALDEEQTLEKLRPEWVDDVFILQTDAVQVSRELIETLIDMGITVHICTDLLSDEFWSTAEISRMGRCTALTKSMKTVSAGELAAKRSMDFAGGIVGCVLTAVLFLFVAPAIYLASPGPVFFSQVRIGRGGKPFRIYKFRSMYPNAEERKKELEKNNKSADGLIFKVDDDPRIIRGIGSFIRKSSIDEFPQFWNVLKGDMSLVGTRPPLREEWERYNVHHRARMTVKPGITGLWQVSGRSEITDFEEIVRLDREYIENWSLKLDVKILLKTVFVVLTGRGAE